MTNYTIYIKTAVQLIMYPWAGNSISGTVIVSTKHQKKKKKLCEALFFFWQDLLQRPVCFLIQHKLYNDCSFKFEIILKSEL